MYGGSTIHGGPSRLEDSSTLISGRPVESLQALAGGYRPVPYLLYCRFEIRTTLNCCYRGCALQQKKTRSPSNNAYGRACIQ